MDINNSFGTTRDAAAQLHQKPPEFFPCSAEDRQARANLELPDIHHALADRLYSGRFDIKGENLIDYLLTFPTVPSGRLQDIKLEF